MDSKMLKKKTKSLLYKNKKRSKKSKKKRVIHEYEKNISNLFKKLKIDDDNDCENSDFVRNVPSNILALESPIRNRLLKCNLKTYSSYATSKSLNIYKQSKSKCIRFISIDKYLQGKVSCTPDFNQCFKSRPFQIYKGSNSCVEINRNINIPRFMEVIEVRNIENVHSGKENRPGDFGCMQYFDTKAFNKYKSSNVLNVGNEFQKEHFRLSEDIKIKHFETNIFDKWNHLLFQSYITLYSKTSIFQEKSHCTFNNAHASSVSTSETGKSLPNTLDCSSQNDIENMEPPSKCSGTAFSNASDTSLSLQVLNMSSKISQTILELFLLELKIKRCRSILKKFKFNSDAYTGFEDMKVKCSNLITKYESFVNEKHLPREPIDECNSFANGQKSVYPGDHSLFEWKGKFSGPSFKKIRIKKQYKKPIGRERMRRNCKRKRQSKDDDNQVPKRSKRLDECIMRASTSKKLPEKKNAPASSLRKSEHDAGEKVGDEEINEASTSGFRTPFSDDSAIETISSQKMFSNDPVDEEINEILSQLPPLLESPISPEAFDEKTNDLDNAMETEHFVVGDGKNMVILPYVDINY